MPTCGRLVRYCLAHVSFLTTHSESPRYFKYFHKWNFKIRVTEHTLKGGIFEGQFCAVLEHLWGWTSAQHNRQRLSSRSFLKGTLVRVAQQLGLALRKHRGLRCVTRRRACRTATPRSLSPGARHEHQTSSAPLGRLQCRTHPHPAAVPWGRDAGVQGGPEQPVGSHQLLSRTPPHRHRLWVRHCPRNRAGA